MRGTEGQSTDDRIHRFVRAFGAVFLAVAAIVSFVAGLTEVLR
jgi:hypothetical protein